MEHSKPSRPAPAPAHQRKLQAGHLAHTDTGYDPTYGYITDPEWTYGPPYNAYVPTNYIYTEVPLPDDPSLSQPDVTTGIYTPIVGFCDHGSAPNGMQYVTTFVLTSLCAYT